MTSAGWMQVQQQQQGWTWRQQGRPPRQRTLEQGKGLMGRQQTMLYLQPVYIVYICTVE